MKTLIFIRRRGVFVTMVVLAGLLLSSAWLQAQTFTDQLSRKTGAEIRAQLQALDREVAAKGYTFQVGDSEAMEASIEELCGLVIPDSLPSSPPITSAPPVAPPSAFDWRDAVHGGNTPVRNQGACGSCWAFGTVGPLEIAISALCGRTENLSEQYLISCNEWAYNCSGGWYAHDYHWYEVPHDNNETEAGAVLEAALPYQGSSTAPCDGPHAHPYKLDSWGYVNGFVVSTPADIKQTIYAYGPVATSICVGPLFHAYASGIFNANETCSATVNHAVTLVGWNDDLGTDNGYWILKNSWGPTWGEGGYMRIRYGTSMVGYATTTIEFSQCPTGLAPALDCGHGPTITLGQTYTGLTNADGSTNVSTYGCTTSAKNAPEKIYQVRTTTAGDLTATLSNQTTDLDVFILSDCDPTICKAFGTNKAIYSNAPAGTYYLVVDGADTNTIGTYDFTATAAALPPTPTLNCTTPTPVTLKVGSGYNGKTLVTDLNRVNNYSCTGRTLTGAEKVHKVTTTAVGDLTATLTNLVGKDLDVFILSGCSENACLAYGDTAATYANAPAGTYYIVVDGYNGTYGTYTVKPTLVLANPDLIGAWTPTTLTSSNAGKTVTGTLEVSNIGNKAAAAFTVGYYYSTNGVKLNKLIKSESVTAGLGIGQDLILTPTITYTASLINYYIIAKVDSGGKVTEKNETNNLAVSAKIQ